MLTRYKRYTGMTIICIRLSLYVLRWIFVDKIYSLQTERQTTKQDRTKSFYKYFVLTYRMRRGYTVIIKYETPCMNVSCCSIKAQANQSDQGKQSTTADSVITVKTLKKPNKKRTTNCDMFHLSLRLMEESSLAFRTYVVNYLQNV